MTNNSGSGRPRILHVFYNFLPGGTELRMVSILNALGDRYVHSILSLRGDFEAASRLKVKAEQVAGPARGSAVAYPFALRRLIQAASPDLLVTYNWGSTDALIACSIAPPCPIIHNECGFGPDEAVALKKRRCLVRRVLLNRIYKTIVVSRRLEATARKEFGLAAGKLKFIQTGVDTSRFHPGPDNGIRTRFGIPANAFLAGFVGRFRPEKRADVLLEAFAAARLEGAYLILVGDGGLRGELEQQARRLGIGDRAVFAGPQPDTVPFYRALDLFVLSSDTEQTPNALLEAMACGLPAVTTAVGDAPAILGVESGPSVVDRGAISQMAESIAAFARDPKLRERQGRRNQERVAQQYSFSRMVEEYSALYAEAIGSRR